jgi:hypothetical protein
MKRGGVFEAYTEELRQLYRPAGRPQGARQPACRDQLLLYRHFSMNQFTIELRRQAAPTETAADTLARIGAAYRLRILGW